jgi:hypothetical protein
MKIPKNLLSFTCVMFVATTLQAGATIGKPAPDFALLDINGKIHQLSQYKGKTVVLEWVNPECPFVRKHYESGNIPRLQKTATADGVVWLSINTGQPGAQGVYDTAGHSKWAGAVKAGPSAYLRDADGKIARIYGAKTTPHMYVIAADGNLVYNGAIDSIRSTDAADIGRAENYVASALAALKSGKPVARATSQPYGCAVKY